MFYGKISQKDEKVMNFNLKDILSNNIYHYVEDYCDNGVDAISLIGSNSDAKVRDIVNYFQALANPEFVNVRENWGSKVSDAPCDVFGGALNYADKKTNAFALKFRANNGFKLRFPLLNSYYNTNSKFRNCGCAELGSILSRLQTKLNFQLEINDSKSDYVVAKEGLVRKISSKLSHPVRMIRAKTFEDMFDPSHKGIGIKKAKLILDTTYNGHKLTSPEQMLAIIDFYNAKANKKIANKMFKLDKNLDKSKIILASQILSDLFISYGFNFGTENSKQIDNALRLQLSNVIASLTYEKSVQIIAEIAERSAYVMTKKLGITLQDIQNNRKNIGVEYLETPTTIHAVMFGETKNNAFVSTEEGVFYQGKSNLFKNLLVKYSYKDDARYDSSRQTAPHDKEEALEPEIVFDTPELEMLDPIEELDTQPEAPRVIYLGGIKEEQPDMFEEADDTLDKILAEASTDSEASFEELFEEHKLEIEEDKATATQEEEVSEVEELYIQDVEETDEAPDFKKLEEVFGIVVNNEKQNLFSRVKNAIFGATAIKNQVLDGEEKIEEVLISNKHASVKDEEIQASQSKRIITPVVDEVVEFTPVINEEMVVQEEPIEFIQFHAEPKFPEFTEMKPLTPRENVKRFRNQYATYLQTLEDYPLKKVDDHKIEVETEQASLSQWTINPDQATLTAFFQEEPSQEQEQQQLNASTIQSFPLLNEGESKLPDLSQPVITFDNSDAILCRPVVKKEVEKVEAKAEETAQEPTKKKRTYTRKKNVSAEGNVKKKTTTKKTTGAKSTTKRTIKKVEVVEAKPEIRLNYTQEVRTVGEGLNSELSKYKFSTKRSTLPKNNSFKFSLGINM